MTIKRKLCKRINGEKEYYLEDKEYHSFGEIKEICYKTLVDMSFFPLMASN